MSWFQLDPESVAARIQATGRPAEIPPLSASLRRGIAGFIVVSVAGFAPWAIFGHWFHQVAGEAGLYVVCALSFILTSGAMMHRLILGPGSLARFYKLFSLSFALYAVGWMTGWMTLRGNAGSIVGLLAGTALMGCMLSSAFNANGEIAKVIAALFALNAAGYFAGGWIEGWVFSWKGLPMSKAIQGIVARLLWGVSYGVGFGAGLGLAFHFCQTKTRALLVRLPAQAKAQQQ